MTTPAHPTTPARNGRPVLVSGAGIAGTTLAYWLHRHGVPVTVVERAPTIRPGGYLVDVRGSALEVAELMGLAEELARAHVDTRRITFVDHHGEHPIQVVPQQLSGGGDRDVELPRGRLAALVHGLTDEFVDYRFGTSITGLTEHRDGIEATLSDGTSGTFDVVVGADGLHSNVRALAFGPEHEFDRSLGYGFRIVQVGNTAGLSREAVIGNRPGQAVALYAADENPEEVYAFLAFRQGPLTPEQADDRRFRCQQVQEAFDGWGWIVPELLEAIGADDDVYADEAKQIVMPTWSRGRTVLVGDAGYSPSFLTGQGTSLAMVGAFVLASELAANADHRRAMTAYETTMRPFVEANQATAGRGGTAILPATEEALQARNRMLGELLDPSPNDGPPAHHVLDLSHYRRDLPAATIGQRW